MDGINAIVKPNTNTMSNQNASADGYADVTGAEVESRPITPPRKVVPPP